jgi:hypothetical protein
MLPLSKTNGNVTLSYSQVVCRRERKREEREEREKKERRKRERAWKVTREVGLPYELTQGV